MNSFGRSGDRLADFLLVIHVMRLSTAKRISSIAMKRAQNTIDETTLCESRRKLRGDLSLRIDPNFASAQTKIFRSPVSLTEFSYRFFD